MGGNWVAQCHRQTDPQTGSVKAASCASPAMPVFLVFVLIKMFVETSLPSRRLTIRPHQGPTALSGQLSSLEDLPLPRRINQAPCFFLSSQLQKPEPFHLGFFRFPTSTQNLMLFSSLSMVRKSPKQHVDNDPPPKTRGSQPSQHFPYTVPKADILQSQQLGPDLASRAPINA